MPWSCCCSPAAPPSGVTLADATASGGRHTQKRGGSPDRQPPRSRMTWGRGFLALQGEVAGGDVAGAERAQLGLLFGAQVLRDRAPGPEPAARRRVDRAGQLALDARVFARPRFGLIR